MLAGIVLLFASPGLAKERSALEIATIKAATDCVAAAALNNQNIAVLYGEGRLKEVTDWIVLKSSACENPLRAMELLHDQLYGAGTGRRFLLGDYVADLPRAVGERIGVEVAKRIAELEQKKPITDHDAKLPSTRGPISGAEGAAGKHWFETYVTAAGGCDDIYYYFNPHIRSQLSRGNIKNLFGKPLVEWSDDDIAVAARVYRDCVAKISRCDNRPGPDRVDCEQRNLSKAKDTEGRIRDAVSAARNLDAQRKAQEIARVELEKLQSQRRREQIEEETRRKQQQMRERAKRDIEAAEEARRLVESEEAKLAQTTREAEEARAARQAAEQRLIEVRSRIEVEERSRREALARSREADAAQQEELQQAANRAVEAQRKQEQLHEQVKRNREAAEEARRLAEAEEPKIAEAAREAEEARRARQAAEQQLTEIRSRIEGEKRARQEALARAQAAQAARQKELQRETESAPSHREYVGTDEVIRRLCLREWGDDFRMRSYCESSQMSAVRTLRMGRPADISEDQFVSVRRRCAGEWPEDFRMRAYCESQQFAAIRDLKR
jgi:hypothetical protein